MEIGRTYLEVVRERFQSLKDLGKKAIEQLTDDDLHWTIHPTSNSVSVLVKHLSGNMKSRWTGFLTTDGEKANRNRDQEFVDSLSTKEEVLTVWEQGWKTLFNALDKLSADQLLTHIYIRGEAHSVIEAIERQMAHYAMHVGQIMFIGKQIKKDEWISLSIPKGQSEAYNKMMLKDE